MHGKKCKFYALSARYALNKYFKQIGVKLLNCLLHNISRLRIRIIKVVISESLATEKFMSSHVGNSTKYLRVWPIEAVTYVKQGIGKSSNPILNGFRCSPWQCWFYWFGYCQIAIGNTIETNSWTFNLSNISGVY